MPRIEARAWCSFQATGQQPSGAALTGSVNGITQRGDDKAFAVALFGQIKGFAEYGFSPSHVASFALLVQASGWIQCAERAAFLVALLDFSSRRGFTGPASGFRTPGATR